ncbi:MAG TPA: hypothetical protein VLT81_01610 [Chondromyces sp.]|nr:hypothetical protein [Chondromyces sp.]
MNIRTTLATAGTLLLVAGTAAADFKVVKEQHTDSFTVMGRETPAIDQQQTSWIGSDRTRVDSGDQTTIIRLDANKLFLVNHADKTFNVFELPVDIESFMPPGMAEQMKLMMSFEVTVTPSDETKQVGEWAARRYDVKMNSKMVNTAMTVWATEEIPIDQDAFHGMYEHLNSLNPGLAGVAKEMRKVDGFIVEQQSVSTMPMMGDASITRLEKTVSIEEMEPPPGTYEVPDGYTEKPFDFMASMQRQ